ncbi:MAG: T9SS type A sorting domain-containing protein [bacterium]|nr:T9SS type A sorting domain-containing protein [bacterium]
MTDFDTSVVNVTLNQAPIANAGNDSTLFQCTPAPICVTASCSDPNGNLSTCQLVSGPGTYNGSAICFTPAGAGVFTFVLKATDACGATDFDTSVVTVTLNQPPVASMGNDSTLFQCGAAPICIPASCSDPNGNLSTCQLVSGPGSYNGSDVCFTPAGAGVFTFVLKATDACGATDFDTAVVTVALNLPPVANAGRDSTLFQCAPAQICITAGCSDPDANLTNCELTSGPGTLNGGGICFTPAASGIYTFIVKATDACGLTDFDTSVVNVTLNQAPVATVGNDSTLFQCTPAPICIAAACSDPNGNLSTCQLVSGPGTYNGSTICFTPASSGSYTLVLKATDACGLTDFDTSVVNVTLNVAPIANAGRDSTLFQCTPAPICIAASCSDANANLSTCNLISGPGTYNGSQICFTPAGAGTFTFVLQATDACGATDLDTSVVTVTSNSAPVVTCPGNQTLFVCNLNQICIDGFSATDAENNIASYQVTGGTIQGNQLCFTPVAGPNMIRVIAIDACGLADTCVTTVTITLNTPPVANAGADQNLNCRTSGDPICWNVSCTDVDAGTLTCELVSPVGTLSGNQICFAPTASGSYTFIMKATDQCGAIDYDTAVVTVRLNVGPEIALPAGDTTFACLDEPMIPWCVPFTYSDPNGNASNVVVTGLPGAVLNYSNGSGTLCFTPPAVTAQYDFTLTVTDSCGLTAQAQHQQLVAMIDCDTATCFVMQIEKTHNSLQGQYEFVSVFIESEALEMGGFDLLIKYDNSGLSFVDAKPGQLLTSCGWEYFTYRYGAIGNCGGPCPSGLLRIVAVADANNGPNHPSCYGAPDSDQHEIAVLKFLVTNDRTFECQYLPVTFFWIDCGDNAVSTVTGDTLYIDKRIYSFEGQMLWDELDNALYPDASRPFGLGAGDYCLLGDKYYPIRCIEFIEGGIDVVCADSIDAPGDLNLNGIAYEIADAVLYTNYFLYGIAALDPDPTRREAQIAASDVNQDGTVLSVGDLVYLLRVIMGDALPFPKLAPFANSASVKWQSGELSINSSTDIGALRAKFRVGDSYQLVGMSGMETLSHEENGEVSVLIYSGLADMGRRIAAGTSQVLHIVGDAELIEIEAADFEGNMLNLSVSKSSLPTEFALGQNRPNPFNPNTQIELDLPSTSEWKIEIFNITGQLVKTLSGSGVGRVVVDWDGSGAPSGVYFYRATAGAFSETRKMVLLK